MSPPARSQTFMVVGVAVGSATLACACLGAAHGFVPPLAAPIRGTAGGRAPGADGAGAGVAAASIGAVCGLAAAAVSAAAGRGCRPSKTAVRYTTKKILPNFTWIKAGLKAAELAPTELKAKTIAGNDVLIGKTEQGGLFCVGNLCPHMGTPMSEGADVIGDIIVCPLHGSSFSTKTGELIDWCPSPPIIGPLTGIVTEQRNLAVLDARTSFWGDDVEVSIDTNAKKAYEADYWKGLLDAQGKVDGTYY
mmetsp:Transcript_136178/g.423118  ORF Transcript_136178/g.423118 Transcript_136178/m.423118 type:complete len:249 (-) Transcript_136178:60-806(-)